MSQFGLGKHSQGFVVAVEGANIDIEFASLHGIDYASPVYVFVDERAHVFVFAAAFAPQLLKR
jgi:hypothetical protein